MSGIKRNMLGTLSTRLSLAFIAVVICVGIGVLIVSQQFMRVYFEEFNQKLNASIAMYITGEYQLIQQQEGVPDIPAIKQLANTAMIVNPAAEVYVLDTEGSVIAHNFPPESIVHQKVPLQPLQQLIAGEAEYPLRNIDPRHSNIQKVFSAAEIRTADQLQGYLYVVLGGAVYDNLEDSLQNSYSRTQGAIAIALIILAAAISGWLIFKLMVQPLSRLSSRMEAFSTYTLEDETAATTTLPTSGDEVKVLTQRFGEMSNKITQQFEQLREADQLKRELISNISHDLRTPLASIQGYLETLLIKNDQLQEKERLEYLNTAMKSSRHLGSLISDLFELSKLDSNHIQLMAEQFSLAELVHDIVQEFNPQLNTKNISVEVRSQHQNALVLADIRMIQRVFENLIRNAITYTPEHGKIILSIDTAEQGMNNCLKVSVLDTGHGINPEDLPHIFDRFYSNPGHSNSNTASTGLGLAIVKRILDLHKVNITVDSKLNQGTRFEFHLPQAA